jgi:superfamily II DNA or RNA helicase
MEVLDENQANIGALRHTDIELVQLRVESIRDALKTLTEDTEFSHFNNWQQDSVSRLQESLSADQTIDLPTRTGKSYLLRKLAAACQQQGVRTVIVAPRRHIINEHAEDLMAAGVPCKDVELGKIEDGEDLTSVNFLSTQSIAVNRQADSDKTVAIDLVLIDEGHKALGPATIEGISNFFPNAVRIAFTATPDYATNRSVTDEYGSKLITHSIVEAINEGKVPPVRAFLYKTTGRIDNLDPANPEFTSRELRRLARFASRNNAILDVAQDLVSQGRQGLITTIPGEDLLHADILEKALAERIITSPDGTERAVRARVVRGSDTDLQEVLDDFEYGSIDVLLYCDLLREGYTTKAASFLLNGRPTTSVVNLTQDIGRVLEPKDGEMIVVDYLDESVKRQCTVYDVLELDRVTQAVALQPNQNEKSPINKPFSRDTFMRGLFRPSIVENFQSSDQQLLYELYYVPGEQTPYERQSFDFAMNQAKEAAKQTRIWRKILANAGLGEDMTDNFMIKSTSSKKQPYNPDNLEEGYVLDILEDARWREKDPWSGFERQPVIVPTVSMPNEWIDGLHPTRRVNEVSDDPQDIVVDNPALISKALEYAFLELTEREAGILRLACGLEDGKMHTLGEVGEEFNVTRERIRQIESKAMAKLRHPWRHNVLRGFIDDDYDWREPSREIQAHLESMRESSAPATQETSHETAVAIDPQDTVEQNKRLMKQRNSYYKTLSELTTEQRHPSGYYHHEDGDSVIKEIARQSGYVKYDFKRREEVIRKLAERDSLDKLVEAAIALRQMPDRGYWHSYYEEEDRLATHIKQARVRYEAKISKLLSILDDNQED